MKVPEQTLESIEKELFLRANGDYEVRVYTLICALNQSRIKHKEEVKQMREILKACIAHVMHTADNLNCISTEANELALRAMDFLIKGSET